MTILSARRTDLPRAAAWGLAVLLTAYLGLSGGGYDIVVRSEIGLVIWWCVLLGVLIGLLPRAHVPHAGWIAVVLLAAFLIWTWIGLSWSSSHELTLDDVCRVSTYLGLFLLALCVLTPETTRPLVNGLGCGIAAVSAIAILSKLTPSLFPAGAAGNVFYQTSRLSYPFNYSDGVGEYAALGLPLVLFMATGGRTVTGRAVGGVALLPVLLCLAMTVSRGGILAAAVGVVVFFALIPDRIPRLPTLAVAGIGIAVLMLALLHRAGLRDQVIAPADERHSMLLILCVVLAGSAAAQFVVALLMRRTARPSWLFVSRRGAQATTAGIVAVVVLIVIVGVAAGTVGHLWNDFKIWNKTSGPNTSSNEYFRLLSVEGSHRYQYWQVAWKAFTSSPLHGIGSGTFQFYWNEHSRYVEKIVNAHSLWFETLAETGIVGWLLLAGFFGLIMVRGAWHALGMTGLQRAVVATATAGVFAFCAAASFDWTWQIGVVPMVTMLLAATSLVAEPQAGGQLAISRPPMPRASATLSGRLWPRFVLVPAAVLAMILIAIPLASTIAVRASQAAYNSGNLREALADANAAQAIEPGAASPYLQQALVLEEANDIAAASRAIGRAIAREPDNYQLWIVAMRIATEANRPREALTDYNRSIVLWPSWPSQIG